MLPLLTETASEQRTDAWRQDRAGCATASVFADIVAKLKSGGYAKARTDLRMRIISERLTGTPAAEINAAALYWGKEAEPLALNAYEDYSGHMVECAGFTMHPRIEWCGASPDGLVGEYGMIEIKCPFNSANHLLTLINASKSLANALLGEKLSDKDLVPVPPEHLPQIQGNLWVLDRPWCDFISFDPRMPAHLQLYVHRVYRDDAYIANLEIEVVKFLEEVEENVGMLMLPDTIVQHVVPAIVEVA
jgi:hypothetical protein